MNCPMQSGEHAEILLDYFARALPADTLARMDEHVAMCPSCREQLSAQQQVWAALDEFDAAELTVSADFDRRLYARIEAEHKDPLWVRLWRGWFQSGQPGAWRPALSMGLAGVAVITFLLVRLPNSQPEVSELSQQPAIATSAVTEQVEAPPVKTATVDKVDVEGLETVLEDLEMLQVLAAPAPAGTSAL